MDNLIQNEAEMKEVNEPKMFASIEAAEMNEETGVPSKDEDTMVCMIVLLLACLGLAALAHVFV